MKLPEVTGFTVEDAKNALKGLSIEYSGEGENIVYQSPSANTYIKEGGTVKLMLG